MRLSGAGTLVGSAIYHHPIRAWRDRLSWDSRCQGPQHVAGKITGTAAIIIESLNPSNRRRGQLSVLNCRHPLLLVQGARVAQTSAFEVCGSSLDSRSRTRGHAPVFEICSLCKGRTADPKNGGSRYLVSWIQRQNQEIFFPRPLGGKGEPQGGGGPTLCGWGRAGQMPVRRSQLRLLKSQCP